MRIQGPCINIRSVAALLRSAFGASQKHRYIALACLCLLATTGCELRQRMFDQPKYEPLEESDFWGDRRSARPLVEGTVAQGHLNADEHLYTGRVNGELAASYPFEITEEVMARGQERFNIYCSVCHDRAGTGNGMVVQRGFKRPSSYHIDRLRDATPGYFFDVMTQGFGVMASYSYQLSVEDRWAVAAYIKALQRSQNANIKDVPEDKKDMLAAGHQ